MKTSDKGARLIDYMSHACAAKLIAVIAEDADEVTLKAAVAAFPAIIRDVIDEVALQFVENRGEMAEEA